MKLEQARRNVFTLTVTMQELSALIAASRLALDVMRNDPHAPPEAIAQLTGILHDYDAALERTRDADGRSTRPS